MWVGENKSEYYDIKLCVFYGKINNPSSFCGKMINFVTATYNVAKCNIVNTQSELRLYVVLHN